MPVPKMLDFCFRKYFNYSNLGIFGYLISGYDSNNHFTDFFKLTFYSKVYLPETRNFRNYFNSMTHELCILYANFKAKHHKEV